MRKATVIVNFGTHLINPGKVFSHLHFSKYTFRYFVMSIPVVFILLISTSYQRGPDKMNAMEAAYFSPATVDSLKAILSANIPDSQIFINGENPVMMKSIRTLYSHNGYTPVWTGLYGLNGRATSLLYLIEHARDYGLEPSLYHYSTITELKQKKEGYSPKDCPVNLNTDLELLLTDAAFRLMVNLHAGYISFDSILYSTDWFAKLPDILLHGIASGQIIEKILSMQPRFIEYVRLQHANENFVRTNTLTDKSIEINYPSKDSLVMYAQITEALKMMGYLNRQGKYTDITNALKEFQHYHGLEPDGKPGKNTVDALKQSSLYRYRVLALNLDRLRKKESPDSNLLYVNIPAYQLKVFKGNSLQDTFRIIVGHPSTPTPMLSGRMERIIANPMWYVPRSIAMNEILPKIKSDSNYLKRNGFKVLDRNLKAVNYETLNLTEISDTDFDYTFRQDRGSDNSLGLVKFVFSNPYAIYLHDTPGKTLFSKDLRAFSHGCVRVQDSERLAGYILHEINGDSTNINSLIANGNHYEFNVSSPLTVQIMYVTCEADVDGKLYFYKDIYGTDKKELEQLARLMDI